jgi:hypothetical protein
MIFKKSCPVRGLKMKMAPLIGFVVRLPSKVCKHTNPLSHSDPISLVSIPNRPYLMNGDAIDIRVIDEPYDLIAE